MAEAGPMRPTGRAALFVIAGVFLVAGCTARGGYEGVRSSARIACAERPPSQYEACTAQASMSWQRYERERQALRDDARATRSDPP